MNQKFTSIQYLIVALLLFFQILISTSGQADTNVSGTICNATWTSGNSPYVLTSSVTVMNGCTLQVESGVTIDLKGWQFNNIGGTILVNGTTILSSVSGADMYIRGNLYDGVNYNAVTTISDSSIMSDNRIYVYLGSDNSTYRNTISTLNIDNSVFDGPHYISTYDTYSADINITDSTFTSNEAGKIYINPFTTGSFNNNTTDYQVALNSPTVEFTGNTITQNQLFLSDVFGVDRTIAPTNGVSSWCLSGSVTVSNGHTLKIEPGVTLDLKGWQFNNSGGTLLVNGATIISSVSGADMYIRGNIYDGVNYNAVTTISDSSILSDNRINLYLGSDNSTYRNTTSTLNIDNSVFDGPHYISTYDTYSADINITDSTFTSNEAGKIYINPFTTGSFNNNTTDYQVALNSPTVEFTGNTITQNQLFLSDVFGVDRTIAPTNGVSSWCLSGSITISNGHTLKIEPGVTLDLKGWQFNNSGGTLLVNGATIISSVSGADMYIRGNLYDGVNYNAVTTISDSSILSDNRINLYLGSDNSTYRNTTSTLNIDNSVFDGPHYISTYDTYYAELNISDSTFNGEGTLAVNSNTLGTIHDNLFLWTVDNTSIYVAMYDNSYNTGDLAVYVEPVNARLAGVTWSLREYPYVQLNSGQTFLKLKPGTYTIHFEAVDGWSVPPDRRIEVEEGMKTTHFGACEEEPIGADPILELPYCVGFSKNFYVFEVGEMPEDEQFDNDLNDLSTQVKNLLTNIILDQISPSSLLVSFATNGVATWINTTVNVMQLAGLAEQSQMILLDKSGQLISDKRGIKIGEPLLPIIFVKTSLTGVISPQKLHIYANYDENLILSDTYDEKFTLETNSPLTVGKPHTLYMLIPRTTALEKIDASWDFVQATNGRDGVFINTPGRNYMFQFTTILTNPPLGQREYFINVLHDANILPILNLLLNQEE